MKIPLIEELREAELKSGSSQDLQPNVLPELLLYKSLSIRIPLPSAAHLAITLTNKGLASFTGEQWMISSTYEINEGL